MSTQRNVHTYTLSSFQLQNPKVKHYTAHAPNQWFLYLRIQPSADQKYFGKNLKSFK